MSGGHFDYSQYHISTIADTISSLVENNNDETLNEWGDKQGRNYSPETIERFQEAIKLLNGAYVYAQLIDWLLSGDDSEETFHKRLNLELEKLRYGTL